MGWPLKEPFFAGKFWYQMYVCMYVCLFRGIARVGQYNISLSAIVAVMLFTMLMVSIVGLGTRFAQESPVIKLMVFMEVPFSGPISAFLLIGPFSFTSTFIRSFGLIQFLLLAFIFKYPDCFHMFNSVIPIVFIPFPPQIFSSFPRFSF